MIKLRKNSLAIAALLGGAAFAVPAAAVHMQANATGKIDGKLFTAPAEAFAAKSYAPGDDETLRIIAANKLIANETDRLGFGGAGSPNVSPDYFDRAARAMRNAEKPSTASRLPEPATWGMLMIGFGGIGFAVRRVQRRSEARFNERIRRIAAGENV